MENKTENNKSELLSRMLRQVGAKSADLVSSGSSVSDLVEFPGEVDIATKTLDMLLEDTAPAIGSEEQLVMEKIVMPYYRPVIDIINGRMVTTQLSNKWNHLSTDETRSTIESTFQSIGRIEIPHHPTLRYAGTGSVVAVNSDDRGILMTNRHVAEIFSTGVGVQNLQFRPGQTATIDFLREHGQDDASEMLTVEKVLMIHPYWDMALLQVVGLIENRVPLKLSVADPASLQESEVVTVGYPGYEPTDNFSYQQLQLRIFRGVYYVKRLQPGILKNREDIESYNRIVPAVTHDCTTAGGNSGSSVLLLPKSSDEPIQVVGLHFGGRYLDANYAVSTYDLASDSRIVDTGINFFGTLPHSDVRYETYWSDTNPDHIVTGINQQEDTVEQQNRNISRNNPVELIGGVATWKIPLEVTVSMGTPAMTSSTSRVSSSSGAPKAMAASNEGLFFGSQPEVSLDELRRIFTRSSLTKQQFNWRTALSLAAASELAYKDQDIVEDIGENSWGLSDCKFLDVNNTQCFIASWNEVALIAFRGSASVGDWLANFDFYPLQEKTYGKVHEGFYDGFVDVKELLEQEIEKISPSKIVLTGHSLGGALSVIAAAEWSEVHPISAIYTFGQPAVGRKGLFDFFTTHYADKVFRLVNDDDIVTQMPPTYKHLKRLFHLNAQGILKSITEAVSGEGETKMMSEAEFYFLRAQLLTQRARRSSPVVTESFNKGMVTEGLFPSISDHSLSEYIRKIKNNISNA